MKTLSLKSSLYKIDLHTLLNEGGVVYQSFCVAWRFSRVLTLRWILLRLRNPASSCEKYSLQNSIMPLKSALKNRLSHFKICLKFRDGRSKFETKMLNVIQSFTRDSETNSIWSRIGVTTIVYGNWFLEIQYTTNTKIHFRRVYRRKRTCVTRTGILFSGTAFRTNK